MVIATDRQSVEISKQNGSSKSLAEEEADIEWRKCQRSAKYFMSTYAYILDHELKKRVKWQPWQYLLDLLDVLDEFDDIVLFKARQLGWTWTVSGWADHKVSFSEAAKGLLLSQGEKEAWDFLGKAKYIIRQLPDYLRLTEKHTDNRALLDFKSTDSLLEALPSTDKAGRSTDASFVLRDELAQHPFGKENFAAIGPTVDAGSSKLIDLSTIDKMDLENHFTERVNKALMGASRKDLPSGLSVYTGGESGGVLVFGGWKLRPIRHQNMSLEEWFDLKVKPKYTAFQIEQEYPETIEDALRVSETRAFFDIEATEAMLLDSMQPIEQDEINTYNGIIKVFKPSQIGRKYIVYTDPSDGVDDPFASVCLDVQTWEVVATAHGKITADRVGRVHDELVRGYNSSVNTGEINGGPGQKFLETIQNLETPNILPRRNADGEKVKDRVGHYATPRHKKTMLYGLEEAVRRRVFINHDREATNELKGFIIPPGGEPQATGGMHDDFIDAFSGALWYSRYVQMGEARITSSKYH